MFRCACRQICARSMFCCLGCAVMLERVGVFFRLITKEAAQWLRIALEARDVPRAREFGLHSLRRGAANALVLSGGDLSTLLRAGGWRSSAFRAYLDLVGLERKVLATSIQALVDLDSHEND